MVAVVQTVSPGRRDLIWCAGWCAVLAAGTGAAAVLLMSHNFAQRSQVVTDPQGHAEQLAAWRGAAILAYSSGSEVGHVCAVAYEVLAILGYVLGRTNHARARVRRNVRARHNGAFQPHLCDVLPDQWGVVMIAPPAGRVAATMC
jgi:hypothetical protein